MSSTLGIAEQEPDPNSVGYKFVKQYYEALSKEPAKLHRYVSPPTPPLPSPCSHTRALPGIGAQCRGNRPMSLAARGVMRCTYM